jgi:TonB-linked SusC/RagA family outer membrane protein
LNLRNCLFLVLLLTNVTVFAQQKRVISGKVYDAITGQPLELASVLIENKKIGSVTNASGFFSYTVNASDVENTVLVVSYTGFKTQKIKLGRKNYFEIYLQEDAELLDDIIITSSYGTKKLREEVVGSIQQLNSKDLQVNQNLESFDKMLDGVATGVIITGGSTQGTPVKIDIRGQGSLTPLNNMIIGTSTQPLIIVDGVIMAEEAGFDNELFDGSGTLTEQFSNPLTKISPEDIETINILKDVAAVGLYGADAANGVIVITTKRGKSTKTAFNFSTQFGFSNPINQIKYLSGPQYFDIYREYLISQGQTPEQASLSAGSSTTNTNWFDLLNQTGYFRRYNFDVSQRIKNWNFRAAVNVLQNTEPQVANSFIRYAGSFNAGYANNKFSVQVSASPSIVVRNLPNTLNSFPLPSNISPTDENGDFSLLGFNGFGNPLAVARQNLNKTNTFGVVGSVNLSYKINSLFKINSLLGVDYANKEQNRYFSGFNESGWFNGTFTAPNADGSQTTFQNRGRRLNSFRQSFKWNQSTQLTFEAKKNNHNFDGILGLELQREAVDNQRELGSGFVNPGPVNNAISASNYQLATFFSENAKRSVYSQFNYNYNKKYFLLVNLRRDESSAFGNDSDVAFNGGAGASWNISSENIFKEATWLDFFRTRISYGVAGNSRIGSYRSLGLYLLDNQGNDGYNGFDYAVPNTPPNPFLTWESNYKFNWGFDFNVFNKLKITVDYFRDNIQNMIVSRQIPAETGFTSMQINGADMVNSGIEFSAQMAWIKTKNFRWNTNFNISSLRNEITSLTGLGSTSSTSERARSQRVGSSTTAIWGIRSAGIDPATGRELFSKDGQLYDGATYRALYNDSDWEIIGDSQPDFYGGMQNNFSFFNRFNLTIRAAFRHGDEILIDDEMESQYRVLINRNMSVNALDRWQQPGDIAVNPRVTQNNPIIQNQSRFVYDASHIRIQNINLSYSLPKNWWGIKAVKSSNINIDISNVAYFYKEKSLRGRNRIAEYRFEYPESRTFTIGFQASF